jgi:hypothetical protein
MASLHVFPSGTELETGAIFNTLQHSAKQAITYSGPLAGLLRDQQMNCAIIAQGG